MIGNAILHFLKCIQGLDKPHSQTTSSEQAAIAKYSKEAQSAIEIGVYEGVNTAIIASSISAIGKLYAIDPFFKGKLGICYYKKIAINHTKSVGVYNKITFIAEFSFDAANDIPSKVDFIFVDGDHSFEGIKKDWELYAGKVKSGGIIALHDTSIPSHYATVANLGSYKFFNEYISKDSRFNLIETVDSLNILQKK